MKRAVLFTFLVTASMAGCSGSPGAPGEASFLRAAVSGAVTDSYEGRAEFHVGTPGPGRQQFHVSSYGTKRRGHSFAVTRWDGGRPAVGSYALTLPDLDAERPQGIMLQYFHTGETHEAQFVALEGILEITHSSQSRVEGRFTATAQRYCLREIVRSNPPEEPIGPCLPPAVPLADAPAVQVVGTFAAVPLQVGPIELRR